MSITSDAYRAITAAMVADIMSSGEWSVDTLDQVRDVLVNRGELDQQAAVIT
jgi:predicted regulator of Ras-like GTPase activity (Roadblock/LC7/MglB family)